jgi:hypothetical protein
MPKKKHTPMEDLPPPRSPFPKHPGGRPSVYQPEFCTTVLTSEAIRDGGATDQVIADHIGVDRASIRRWRDEHPEFADACAQAKDAADDVVEASLFQRAKGYEHEAVKIGFHEGRPVYADYTERYAPDTGAAMNWLKNRRPDRWRERVEHTGADGKDLQPQTINVMDVAKAIGLALRLAAERIPGDDAKVINGRK